MLTIDENEKTEHIKEYNQLFDNIKDDILNITSIPASLFENIDYNYTGIASKYNTGNNPCEKCPNNPKNNLHATGFCNCALLSLMNPIY